MKEKVNFKTEDGVNIYADYYKTAAGAPSVLLLHMMPATKESWEDFADVLSEKGFNVLAIDLRGHGESIDKNGEELDFKKFVEEEHRDSYQDIEAAIDFLKKDDSGDIALSGASIGANLSIWYQADHEEIKATIPLSAGFNYKGIETEPLVEKIDPTQHIYFVGARGDTRSDGSDCAEVAETLFEKKRGNKEIKIYEESSAHGTDLFKEDSELIPVLVEWLKSIYF